MEGEFPETAETQPELLAHHYTEGGNYERAIAYWHRAGQLALERSGNQEAIRHLRRGLALLKTLPETPERLRQELNVHTALGPALMVTQGAAAPEVAQIYARIETLAAHLQEIPHGLWVFYYMRGEIETAQRYGAHMMEFAQRTQDPALLFEARMVLGFTALRLGEVLSAQTHFEQGITLYDPQQHHVQAFLYAADPGVILLCYAARVLWLLGYPAQALERSQEAIRLAHRLSHPFSQAYALTWTTVLLLLRRDWQAVQQRAEEVLMLATAQGFPFLAEVGTFAQGMLRAEQGQKNEGIAQMAHSVAGPRAVGMDQGLPFFLGLLAAAYDQNGQTEAGLALLDEALAVAHHAGGRYWEAELHRLQGELLLHQRPSAMTQAARCLSQALSVAQSQQAKSWELRAATSLARLWQSQGKHQDAYDLLAPVYEWFTEGFDTADLQEAKRLLQELAQ